jgi:prevent-host-death family protein
MPRTVSASEAKTKFGSIAGWTVESNDDVIVESHGKPSVVIMSFAAYQKVKGLREEAYRRAALAELECLREKVLARNPDLDEAGAEGVADRFSKDVIEDMVREKKVTFKD